VTAYYNEIDPKAAAWLRELIARNLIAPGDVDERSISDVKPDDLRGYTQCHFFAGIGVWSHALQNAGWPDDRPVWTGSCPCQPFSSAGKRKGTSDERHLWPHWFWLISQCHPVEVFGEQVASKDGRAWFDTVQTDMEALGFAVGAADLCAAGVGAPHIRQRLWFYGTMADTDGLRRAGISGGRQEGTPEHREAGGMADGEREGLQGGERVGAAGTKGSPGRHGPERGSISGVGDSAGEPCKRDTRSVFGTQEKEYCEGGEYGFVTVGPTDASDTQPQRMADDDSSSRDEGCQDSRRCDQGSDADTRCGPRSGEYVDTARPTNGFWRDVDWLGCRDGKLRPVRPGTFPLVDGSPARVGRLRGYGNAIVAPVAQTFIEATQGW